MKVVSDLKGPLLVAVCLTWTFAQTSVRGEIFTYRDDRGVTHFSNVRENPRWVPLRIPPVRRAPTTKEEQHAYPFASIVTTTARQYDVDAELIRAIIKVESDFNPRARSSRGAMGLMQLLPKTAQPYGDVDLFEPNENIRVGVRHLKVLLAQFRDDLRLTLAAYNAGPAAVNKHGGVPPFPETIEYIDRVLRLYHLYGVEKHNWSRSPTLHGGTQVDP